MDILTPTTNPTTPTYTLLGGRLRFYDIPNVWRPTEDALWIALHALPKIQEDDKIVDIGCGNGVIGIALAKLCPPTCIQQVDCSDISEEYLHAAKQNAALNTVEINAKKHNILQNPLPQAHYNHVISNPPYHPKDKGFTSNKRLSEHGASHTDLAMWIHTCVKAVKEGGYFTFMIHSQSLAEVIPVLNSYACTITHLKSSDKRPAKRVIIQMQKVPGIQTEQTIHTYDPALRKSALEDGCPWT